MTAHPSPFLKIAGVFAMFLTGCGDDGGDKAEATGGASGTAATGGATSAGGTSGASGAGGTMVPTPEGTLFMDDFEAGATKWDVTQGTCSIMADTGAGSNVFNCINGGNEARAVTTARPSRFRSGKRSAAPRAKSRERRTTSCSAPGTR